MGLPAGSGALGNFPLGLDKTKKHAVTSSSLKAVLYAYWILKLQAWSVGHASKDALSKYKVWVEVDSC